MSLKYETESTIIGALTTSDSCRSYNPVSWLPFYLHELLLIQTNCIFICVKFLNNHKIHTSVFLICVAALTTG